jgi:hypothetical protein
MRMLACAISEWRHSDAAGLLGIVWGSDFRYFISRPHSFSISLITSHVPSVDLAAMHVSLDNISFYSHPSAKSSSRAFPASCWRAYNASMGPQPLPHALSPRPYFQEATFSSAFGASTDISLTSRDALKENLDSRAGNEFDIEIERAITQNSQEMHERDLGLHLDLGARDESHTNVPESDHTYLVTGMSESLLNCDKQAWLISST